VSLEVGRDRLVFRWRGAKYEWTIEPRYWRNPLIYVGCLIIVTIAMYFVRPSILPTLISANLLAAIALPLSWMTIGTGRINLGPQLFVGVGGYIAALLSVNYGFSAAQTFPIVLLGSLAVGFIISPLTTVARGLYFCLLTLIIPLIFMELTFIFGGLFHGDIGISGIAPLVSTANPLLSYLIAAFASLIMMLIYLYIVDKVTRSRIGLIMGAINDDEDVANMMGVNINRIKILSFAIPACLIGIVGWFYAHYYCTFAGVTYLPLTFMIKILLVLIVGGRTQIYGCVIAAYFISFLEVALTSLVGMLSPLTFPIILLILICALPEGLYGIYRKSHYRDYLPTVHMRR